MGAKARRAAYEIWLLERIPEWNAARLRRLDAKIAAKEARLIAKRRRLPAPGIRAEPVRIEDPEEIRVRLEANCIPEPNSGCWLWLGPIWSDGYGRVSLKGRMRRVARVSYAAYKGAVPRGGMVLHRCDQPTCVNPDHLYIGTARDNFDDMVLRGRQAARRSDGRYAKAAFDSRRFVGS